MATSNEDDHAAHIFLVDDHAVVRRGLRAFLDLVPGFDVVGEASDGQAALDELTYLQSVGQLPDVVLMDLLMPRLDGVAATREIRARMPAVHVVAITSYSEAERVHGALEAGAAGYLLKDAEADEVATAIRSAVGGKVHLDAAVAQRLTRSFIAPQETVLALTTRERDVIKLVAEGCSNGDIADRLFISERTARTHVSNILTKLGLASRTQAALWALREGFLTSPADTTLQSS